MLTVGEALRIVLDHARPLPPRKVRLESASGLVLGEDIIADLDLPPFDKALVDGYAVRSGDLADGPPWKVRVIEEITAGRTPTRALGPGECASIMTGAPLPPGADAVVMHEETERLDGGWVVGRTKVKAGQNRLLRGRELREGEVLFRRGERLDPPRLGVVASAGRDEIEVVPPPRVAVVPTGDELVSPSRRPGPGQIRESNSYLLRSLARSCGAETTEGVDIIPDDFPSLERELAARLCPGGPQGVDVLIVCGGVSAGKKDLVPSALEAVGVKPVFHKVRVRPGKPLWFGIAPDRGRTDDSGTTGADALPCPLVFGLPGNPVSGLVCFLLFVKPALEVLAGLEPSRERGLSRLPLSRPFSHRGERATYHPATLVTEGPATHVETLDWAGSADLRAVSRADGFAVFAEGDRDYAAGDAVEFLPMPWK